LLGHEGEILGSNSAAKSGKGRECWKYQVKHEVSAEEEIPGAESASVSGLGKMGGMRMIKF